jgi:hypothetical protein
VGQVVVVVGAQLVVVEVVVVEVRDQVDISGTVVDKPTLVVCCRFQVD